MINSIPVIGWIISAIVQVSLAIPFYICWTSCGLGTHYFYWLPERYHSLPFWHTVGLFVILSIIKDKLTPKFASVSQTNNNGEKKG